MKIGSKVLIVEGDRKGMTGILRCYHSTQKSYAGIEIAGLKDGHDLEHSLAGTNGWFVQKEYLELIEPAWELKDPLFTLEEITDYLEEITECG